jgi:lactate dehydrogenase-like 2-hydroxyacid dehydrogenase
MYRLFLLADEGNACFVTFDELIRTADVVTLHTPLTSETRHMLSDVQFSKMKDGVFIVNTSRGAGKAVQVVCYPLVILTIGYQSLMKRLL